MVVRDIEGVRRAQRAKEIYDETIRACVEPAWIGDFVVVDVATGDYEVDADKLVVLDRLKQRRPDADPFLLRAGSPTAAILGGSMRSRASGKA